MSVCPNCESSIEVDFGMASCASCGVVVFVELDGNVRVHESPSLEEEDNLEIIQDENEVAESSPEEELEQEEECSVDHAIIEDEDFGIDTIEAIGQEEILSEELLDSVQVELNSNTYTTEEPTDDLELDSSYQEEGVLSADLSVNSLEEEDVSEELGSEELGYDNSNLEEEIIETSEDGELANSILQENNASTEEGLDLENFSDVVEFANSGLSQCKEGAYAYSLVIEGIDTKDLNRYVCDSLLDERLGLENISSSIKDGVLEIRDMNPVKASVIVNRLKDIGVQIRWVQYAITEMDILNDIGS